VSVKSGEGHYGDYWLRLININSTPPEILTTYTSSHLGYISPYYLDSLLICHDAENPDSELAFFNVSDPFNIDTFITGLEISTYGHTDEGLPRNYAIKDSILYGVSGEGGVFIGEGAKTNIFVINIADYRNPVFDTVYTFNWWLDGSPNPTACIIVDNFLYVVANYNHTNLADVFDISDPTHPVLYGHLGSISSIPHVARCMNYQYPYLYVGHRIYNISTSPIADSLVGFLDGSPGNQIISGDC